MPISDLRVLLVTLGQIVSLFLLIQLFPLRLAQNLPSSHLQRGNGIIRKNEQNTFTNSFIVEMEMEKNVYLFEKEKRDFIFEVSSKGFLKVVVTPCASEITWSLNVLPNRKSAYKGYRRRTSERQKVRLVHFKTESREHFKTFTPMGGIYTLSMTSLNSDSHVNIYVTRSPTLTSGYPNLPVNHTVTPLLKKRNLILNWPPGTSVNQWVAPVEYCVSLSQIKHFKTHCSLLAHKHGDRLPQYTRWSLPGERAHIRHLRAKAKPIRKVKRRLLFHQCIGNKTSFSYTKIKRGKKYFIDVYIVNSNTNQTSYYGGTSIERKKRKRKKSYSSIWLGETKTISLKKNKGFEISLNQTISKLVFEILPCSGKVNFELSDPKKKRRRQGKVRLWKRVILRKAKPGVYRMTFPGKRKKSSFVTVSLAYTLNKSDLLILPKKRNIKMDKSRTSCSNVTLEWTAEASKHEYCVYTRILDKDGRDSRKLSCLSPSERPVSERVLCATYTPKTATPNFHIQTLEVTDLHPSTHYRFDVFIRYGQSLMIPYKSVKEKTKEHCNRS